MVSSFAEEGTNKAGLRMGVAAAYLFLLIYSIGIDVAGVVFYSELFPNHLRAKGLALSICVIALTDLIYLQVASTVSLSFQPSLLPLRNLTQSIGLQNHWLEILPGIHHSLWPWRHFGVDLRPGNEGYPTGGNG